jgi:hypothetical protein
LDQWIDSLSLTTEHEVIITGLVPDTQYFYSVETTAEVLSSGPDHFFLTAPPVGTKKKSRIWILGDSGSGGHGSWQYSVRNAYYNLSVDTHTDLWVMLGDNAYPLGTDMQYQEAVFESYQDMLKKSVLWPAFGNHDTPASNSNTQTGPFYDIFSLPSNAEAGGYPSGTEAYYSFDYANIHFICLNSHDINRNVGGEMCSWLLNDLAATTQEWVIAYWHHPAYSKGSHDSDTEGQLIEMRENVLPILEQGGADLVFYGHSHNYERSYLIDSHYGYSWELSDEMILNSGDGREDGNGAYTKFSSDLTPHEGTVYFTAGTAGGGTIWEDPINHPAMYISYNEYGSVILEIEGSRADITFLSVAYYYDSGDILDYLTLYKGPPVWYEIPDTSFYEDNNLYINLNDYVYDDGDPDSTLIISIEGSNQIFVNLDSVSHIVNFSSIPDSSGFTDYFIITVTDPWGATDVDTFSVTILPVNDAPVLADIDAQTINEDTAKVITLSATDIEEDTLTYSASSADTNITVIVSNDTLTLTPVVDWNGQVVITVIVTDGSLSDTTSFTLTLLPVNDAPVIVTAISNTMVDEDSDSVMLADLDVVFNDVDSDLTFSYTNDNTILLSVNIEENNNVMLTLSADSSGIANLTFIADDGEYTVTASVVVTVNPLNDPPGIVLPDTFEFSEDGLLAVDFTPYFNDIDSDTSLVLTADGNAYIDVAIDTFLVTFTADTNWNGFEDIIFTIDDQNLRFTDSDTVRVSVLAVNDAPVITALDSVTTTEDSFAEVNLVSSDMDEDSLEFTASSDTTAVTTDVDGTNLTLTPEENWNGTADITVFVTDGSLSDTTSFVLTVTSVNDAPFFTMSFSETVGVDDSITIMIQAEDIDSQDLTYSVSGQPEWLILNGNIISGISPVDSLFVFEISVADGELVTTEQYTLIVENFSPVITSVTDVPEDQGGRVYIDFQKSFFDADTLSRVEGYQVERMDDVGWVSIGTYNANGADSYIIEVNTLIDSSNSTDGMTIFRVIANMDEGNFASVPDSGYSVDNIDPGIPEGVLALSGENEIVLTWYPNDDEDLQFYGIYKSIESGFDPDTMDTYSYATEDTVFMDTLVALGITYYYRLSAFDYHGNESGYAEQVEATFLNTEDELLVPTEFALHQNYPNPFNPVTTLRYDLPENDHVTIIIYDMLGRQVKTLMDQTQDAGYRSIIWDATNDYGNPVSAGIYLYQIQAGEYMQTKKMVLLK